MLFRSTCAMIPWDFTKMGVAPDGRPVSAESGQEEEDFHAPPYHLGEAAVAAWEIRRRRGVTKSKPKDGWDEFYSEIDEWQEMIDGT